MMGFHVDPAICTMSGNRIISLLRFKGTSHETRDKSDLNREFKILNRFFQALGKKEGKNLMIQTYITKSKIRSNMTYKLDLPVIQDFVDAYTTPFSNGTFREVGYTIGLILKYQDLDDGISRMREMLTVAEKMLEPFGVAIMGMEENEHGNLYSQIGRFYSLIFNGMEQDILISDTRLGDAVIDSETGFAAYDYVENRPNHGTRRFATTYDLRDYPEDSVPGMWDEAIEEQFDFTVIQTFLFEDRNKVKRQFKAQSSDLASTEGESSQTDDIKDAIQEVTQGKKVFGRYHASLIVYGETPESALANGSKMESLFLLREATFVRSTSTNLDTWLTQYPAHLDVIYHMPKSTENLACGFSLHTTPAGKALGNPPGDGTALMPLKTVKEGVFFLNAHDSPPGKNTTGEKYPGHISNLAMTGAGKTTIEATELIFFSRWDTMYFVIDYNNSLENVLRALNTQYYSIEPGEFTGIQLFQLPDSTRLREFLYDTVKQCAGGDEKTTPVEEKEIQDAIEAVLNHKTVSNRSFSLLLQYIPERGGDCLHTRLAKWCRSANGQRGQYSWVIDAPVNKFDPRSYRRLAFDCTTILNKEFVGKHPLVMEVLLNTFYFLKKMMHEQEPGCLLINVAAEVWAPLTFQSTADAMKEVLHAGRTRGEILMIDTQTPESILNTEYGASFVQQIVTQQWMANDKANRESYEKFNIKGKEFEKIHELGQYSREFMVKQGHKSVMVKFDLDDSLKYWLPLLSSTQENLKVAKDVREKLGSDDPAIWVAPFLDEMIAKKVRKDKNTEDPNVWVPEFRIQMNKINRPIALTLPI
jgi:type IV secretion system protein VirB4